MLDVKSLKEVGEEFELENEKMESTLAEKNLEREEFYLQ